MARLLHISLKTYSEICFQTHLLELDKIKMILGLTTIDSSPTRATHFSICLHLTAISQMLFSSGTAKMPPAQSMEGS